MNTHSSSLGTRRRVETGRRMVQAAPEEQMRTRNGMHTHELRASCVRGRVANSDVKEAGGITLIKDVSFYPKSKRQLMDNVRGAT